MPEFDRKTTGFLLEKSDFDQLLQLLKSGAKAQRHNGAKVNTEE
jgi:hypothetical protein